MKIYKTVNLAIILIAFIFTLLLPGAVIGADIPSIRDVVEGKAKLPTIEELTGGKVKIGDLIDKNNVDLVKEYITPGVYETVKRGMVLKMGTQLPPDQLNPKGFREATERNRGKAVMDKDGAVYYGKIGTIWPGGYPFPWTKSGLEALANHTYGVVWDTWYGLPAFLWYVNSKGEVYKTSGQEVMYVKYSGRTLLPPLGLIPGYDNILIKKISLSTYPRELKGLGQLTERHYDTAKDYDTGFVYLPAFKRTMRVSATTWQDNIAGSDMTYGDAFCFQDPPSDWNLKLIEKKFLLVPEPKNPTPIKDEKGNVSKNVQFDDGKKFPRLGWAIVPVDVVDCTPKIKHIYGKRVAYLPIWPYIHSGSAVAIADLYDRQMKLWKLNYLLYGCQEYLNGDPQMAVTPFSGAHVYDIQVDHATLYWIRQKINVSLDPESMNLGKLLRLGR